MLVKIKLTIDSIKFSRLIEKLLFFRKYLSLTSIEAAYRRIKRGFAVILGLSTFVAMQSAIAKLILDLNFFLLIIAVSAPLIAIIAFFTPPVVFGSWLLLTPFTEPFLKGSLFTLDNVMLLLLFFIVLIRVVVRKLKPIRIDYALIFLTTAYLYFWLRRGIYEDWTLHDYVFGTWGFQALPIVAYFIAKNTVNTKRDISIILGFIVAMGLVWVTVLSYEHFTGKQFLPSLFGFEIELKRQDIGEGRAQGVGEAESFPGLVLCFTFLACLHCALFSKFKSVRIFCISLLCAIPVVIFWTYTKNAYSSFLALIISLPFLAKAQRKLYIHVLVITIICLIPIYIYLQSSNILEALTREKNIYGRLAMNKAAINMFKNHIIFGLGNAGLEMDKYVVDFKNHPTYRRSKVRVQYGLPANDFLLVLAQYGILGFFLLYGGIYIMFRRLLRVRSKLPDNDFYGSHLVNIALCYVIVFFVANLSRESQTSYYIPYCMFTYLGLATRLSDGFFDEIEKKVAGKQLRKVA